MVKRKRYEDSLEDKLAQYKTDLFRALKKVKGFERQRLSRRIHEKGIAQDAKVKFELQVAVLKSLDLHQTAYHYLYSSLLKIKSIANHPDLPEEVTREIPKPELDEKEQTALHHVTSCLFNRLEVRQVMERVIVEVCRALDLPPPEKKKGKKKGGKDKDESESEDEGRDKKKAADGKDGKKERKVKEIPGSDDEKPKKSKKARKEVSEDEDEEMDTDAEEQAFAKYASRLAPSDDDGDADSESESDHIQKGKRRSIRVRDMSISLSPEPSGSASPFGSEPELWSQSGSEPESESESDFDSDSESEPEQPPPKQAKLSKSSKSKTKGSDQTFLPSLMGGYVSGSESASDVDVAPRKNRLGQKQRQAIWEKKFGAGAKHVQQQQKKQQRGKGGARDDGWDLKRGAVGEDGKGRKPWKKGIEGPLATLGGGGGAGAGGGERRRPVTKKDDEGPLHPSWEARKKAKEKEQQQPRRIDMRPNPGNKIVFD